MASSNRYNSCNEINYRGPDKAHKAVMRTAGETRRDSNCGRWFDCVSGAVRGLRRGGRRGGAASKTVTAANASTTHHTALESSNNSATTRRAWPWSWRLGPKLSSHSCERPKEVGVGVRENRDVARPVDQPSDCVTSRNLGSPASLPVSSR